LGPPYDQQQPATPYRHQKSSYESPPATGDAKECYCPCQSDTSYEDQIQLPPQQHHLMGYQQNDHYPLPLAKLESSIFCDFHKTDCQFSNDQYEDSLFRYGYSEHFSTTLWYIYQSSESRNQRPSKLKSSRGWGRLISPHYRWPDQSTSNGGCLMVE